MMSKTCPLNYYILQRVLHWLMALLILFNLIFPGAIQPWPSLIGKGGAVSPGDVALANIHAYSGLAVLALFVGRVAVRLVQGVPALPTKGLLIARQAAMVVHWPFYALLVLMLLSGVPDTISASLRRENCTPVC